MNRLLVIAHVLGGLLMVFSATFLLPLGWSLAVDDGAHASFFISAAGCLGVGSLLWAFTRRFRRELEPRDGPLLALRTPPPGMAERQRRIREDRAIIKPSLSRARRYAAHPGRACR